MDCPIAIIIPNYNGRRLLERYLPSVMAAAGRLGARVVIADDASTDDGAAWVGRTFPEAVVLAYRDNRGFSGNVNRAVADTDAATIILLNSDVEPTVGFGAPLLRHLGGSDVFAAVPMIRQGPGEVGFSQVRFRRGMLDFTHPGEFDGSNSPLTVSHSAYACGAALAFRREVFLELGGFDELFSPYYGEDLDLSYRAWKSGRRIVYEPAAEVFHQHCATIGADKTDERIRRIKARQYLIFQWKNLSDWNYIFAHLLFLPVRLLFYASYPGRRPEWRGMMESFKFIPAVWRARARFVPALSDREVVRRINAGPEGP